MRMYIQPSSQTWAILTSNIDSLYKGSVREKEMYLKVIGYVSDSCY